MRIAYVALHLEKKYLLSGVGRKIQTQLQIWNELNHSVRLFLLSPDIVDFPDTELFPFGSPLEVPIITKIFNEFDRSKKLLQLIEKVKAFRPDLIYLRYGLFTIPLQKLFNIAPVILEINSNDIQEYKSRGWLFYLINCFSHHLIFSNVRGIIPISYELGQLDSISRYKVPVYPIPNGIDLRQIFELPAPNNTTPVLAFVGASGLSWHGVEKLIPLAQQCPDLQIEVVGYNANEMNYKIPPNMHFWGFIPHQKINQVLSKVDVVIGTLALYRKHMNEDSTLKIREALAFGIPVVIGHHDADISDKQFNFVLEIPNTEDNVEKFANEIRNFAYRMMGKRVDRNLIAPLIDQSLKEKKRLEFFAQIIGKHDQ